LTDGLVLGARTSGKNLTCVWCRAKWVLPTSGAGAASGSTTSEGYVNLSNVAGVDTMRDTSSCKHCISTASTMLMVGSVQIIMGRGKDNDITAIKTIGNREWLYAF
jgi:hypothetical protein